MNCGNLYGVYDRKAGYFVNVFVSSNDETAKRSFENLFFTVEDTVFNLCKNDFTLAKLCELSSIPGCTGDAVLVKPMPIMLAADIPDYLIREKRENSFINFMKAKAVKNLGENISPIDVSKSTSENLQSENENDICGEK